MGHDLYKKLKDAIVTVKTEVTTSSFFSTTTRRSSSSGFFINCGYIITTAHSVLLTGSFERDPPTNAPLRRVERIFVHVYNVNGCHKSYVYEAELVGVDGAGDIAVLKINPNLTWNKSLPKIDFDYHPTLCFGRSAKYNPGNTVFVISDPLGSDYQSITQGLVRDNTYTDQGGDFVYEALLTDAPIMSGDSGSPILDKDGNIVGMTAFTSFSVINMHNFFSTLQFPDEGYVSLSGGPTQRFMQPVIETIIYNKNCNHLQLITDPFGDFYRYVKGFMGIHWDNVDAFTFKDVVGENCPEKGYKQILGLVVQNNEPPEPLQTGDIITHIYGEKHGKKHGKKYGIKVGNLKGQITPTLITWQLHPGCTITIKYRKKSECYCKKHKATLTLQEFPDNLDLSLRGFASHNQLSTFISNGQKLSISEIYENIKDKLSSNKQKKV